MKKVKVEVLKVIKGSNKRHHALMKLILLFRALMFAAYEGQIECVKVLLKANASVTVLNNMNR